MDKQVSRDVYRSFRNGVDFLSELGSDAIDAVASAGSDIALVLSPEGRILDISYRDKAYKAWGLDHWVGREWADTVTVESREKIEELLRDACTAQLTRSRQINHGRQGTQDLPIGYRVVSFRGTENRLALGTDMRNLAEMQQRLVRAQIEMEKDYRKIRDVESRYRILFHLAYEPLLVVDSQTLKILDANEGAARFLSRPVKKIAGSSVAIAFARQDQALALETLTEISRKRREETFKIRAVMLDEPVSVRVTPFREFGKTNLLVCFLADNRVGAGLSTVSSLLAIARNLPDAMVVVDDDGKVIETNAAFLDLVRVVSPERLEGKPLDNWLGGSAVDLQVLMANLREHGTVRRFSSIMRDDLGGTEPVEVSATRIQGDRGSVFGFSIRESMRNETRAPTLPVGAPDAASQFTDLVGRVPLKDLVRDTADIIEKLCIEAALKLTDNNRASAADMLGLSRQSLYIKLRRYGITEVEASDAND